MSKPIEDPVVAMAVRTAINGVPNNFAIVDDDGNLLVNKIFAKPIPNTGPVNIQNYIPEQNEIVTFPGWGNLVAIGNGVDVCKDLHWIGTYYLNVTEAMVEELAPSPSDTIDYFQNTGIRDVEIDFVENVSWYDGESDQPLFSKWIVDPSMNTKIVSSYGQLAFFAFGIRGGSTIYNAAGSSAGTTVSATGGFVLQFTRGMDKSTVKSILTINVNNL